MKPVVQNPRKDGFWAVYIRFTFDGRCQFGKTSKVVSSQKVKSKSEISEEVDKQAFLPSKTWNLGISLDLRNRKRDSGFALHLGKFRA